MSHNERKALEAYLTKNWAELAAQGIGKIRIRYHGTPKGFTTTDKARVVCAGRKI